MDGDHSEWLTRDNRCVSERTEKAVAVHRYNLLIGELVHLLGEAERSPIGASVTAQILQPLRAVLHRHGAQLGDPPPAVPFRSAAHLKPLTAAELRVLHLMADGLSNKAIAARIHRSEYTVKTQLQSMWRKLGVPNRTAAVRVGYQRGLLVVAPDDTTP